MKIKYRWHSEHSNPHYWDKRTALWLGTPRLVNLYLNLNDNKLRRLLKKQKGRILDAGCGDGRFLSCADVGVDFSRDIIQRAKSKRYGKSLVLASILNLPFRRKTFDVAFTVDVILHPEPEEQPKAMKELESVADNVYNFLGEHRTVIPFVTQLFKPVGLVPYIAL